MLTTTALCLLVLIPLAFLAGRAYQSARSRRLFRSTMDDVLAQMYTRRDPVDVQLKFLNEPPLTPIVRQQQQLVQLCADRDWGKALLLLEQVDPKKQSRGMRLLHLRLLLKFGRFAMMDAVIDSVMAGGDDNRLVFGALIACNRWSEAQAFYETNLRLQQGSRREAELLDVFSELATWRAPQRSHDSAFDENECRLRLFHILTGDKRTTLSGINREDSFKRGFELGVSCPAEMSALIAFEKKMGECESDASRVHLIENWPSRGDWNGVNLAKVKARFEGLEPSAILTSSVDALVPVDVRAQGAYQCEYCEAVYRPFTVICPCCFTVNMGTPIRGRSVEIGAEIFSACGLDLGALELLSWELHLPASEVDSG